MPMPLFIGETNLDADQLVFFKRQLEHIKSKSYDVKYTTPVATTVFPVSMEAGPGAETITTESFDSVGIMKFISDYADDLPRSDVKGKQSSIIIQSLGGSYGWSIQEVRSAQMARRSLNAMRGNAARRSNDYMQNRIAWHADGSAEWAGLTGILHHPNVTKNAAVVGGWTTATADQMIKDCNTAINASSLLTNDIEVCDTLIMPPAKLGILAVTPRSSTSDTTVLEFLKRVNPSVTFAGVGELKSVPINPRTLAATPVDCMIAFRRSPDHLQLEIPVLFEQFGTQERNLSFITPVHSRIAGFNIYYPLSVTVVDGI
jgi:hypothetical protein